MNTLNDIPEIAKYLKRIGAEPRSMRAAVVRRDGKNGYWKDAAIIRFDKDGKIKVTARLDENTQELLPTDIEQASICKAWTDSNIPVPISVKSLPPLPKVLQSEKAKQNLFQFKDLEGNTIMLQSRVTDKNDEKNYVPWCWCSDGKWRMCEPDGQLPLYGVEQLKDKSIAFIHEGAKSAREAKRIADDEKSAHPWRRHLAGAAHLGWIGGAMNPNRTDWSVIEKSGINRVYIVADNDAAGSDAVRWISKNLSCETLMVQFGDRWPVGFDLADAWPENNTVPFQECLEPATWMTKTIQNGKRSEIALRDHAKGLWHWVSMLDVWVYASIPNRRYSTEQAKYLMRAYSHTNNIIELLLSQRSIGVNSLDYQPQHKGLLVKAEDGKGMAINTFRPSSILPIKGDPSPWLGFLRYMFPKEDERLEVMRWVATLIAHPETRMRYAILLVSETHGTGKTTLCEILSTLVGKHNCSSPTDEEICSAFNSWAVHKRLAIISEIYTGKSWKSYNNLKGIITDDSLGVSEKYAKPYTVQNWCHIVATSNSPKALKIAEGDRRWLYPDVVEKHWPKEKFDKFYKWLSLSGMGIIMQWALEYGDYVASGERAPMTDRKKELIRDSKSQALENVERLANVMMEWKTPVAVSMRDIQSWLSQDLKIQVFESVLELRKEMHSVGVETYDKRVQLDGSKQYIMTNSPETSFDNIRNILIKPRDLFVSEDSF